MQVIEVFLPQTVANLVEALPLFSLSVVFDFLLMESFSIPNF